MHNIYMLRVLIRPENKQLKTSVTFCKSEVLLEAPLVYPCSLITLLAKANPHLPLLLCER